MNELSKEFGTNDRLKYRVLAVIDLIITTCDLFVVIVSLNNMSSGSGTNADINDNVHQNGTSTDPDIATDISAGVWIAAVIVIFVSLIRIGLCVGMLITVPCDASQLGDMFFAIWCMVWIFLLIISGLFFTFVFDRFWYALGASTTLRVLLYLWAYKITNPSEGFCKFLCFIPFNCCPCPCRRSSV